VNRDPKHLRHPGSLTARPIRGPSDTGYTVVRMSQRPETQKPRGWLAEIRSFVFTLVVVAVGIAFVAALFNGGIGGAEELLRSILAWFFDLVQAVIDTVRGFAAGTQQ